MRRGRIPPDFIDREAKDRSRCLHRLPERSVDARHAFAEQKADHAENARHQQRKEEVIGHGVVPTRRILQVLAGPQKQHSSDRRELSRDDQQGMAQIAAFVERFDLVQGSGYAPRRESAY